MGVTVPHVRGIVKEARDLKWVEVRKLLHSRWHEERLLGLLIMVAQAQRQKHDQAAVEQWCERYLGERAAANNWDLVDCSAEHLVGPWLLRADAPATARRQLVSLAKSDRLWDRRIAMVSHLYCVRQKRVDEVFDMAARLLGDKHDLMHKAVGWLLREAGKRDADKLRTFLRQHHKTMPRTALRYAIEKFDKAERAKWMA